MYKVSFLLETITPLFMSGADGKTSELRPSAFKGMMRFWWRAVRAESNIENLWKEEAKIFGAAEERFGRSRVGVQLLYSELPKCNSLWEEIPYEEKQTKKGKTFKNPTKYLGLSYLLYSVFRHEKNIRPFLKVDSEFKVVLSSYDEKILQHVICAFWCLIYFGGIGTRSRRGGGNLAVKEILEGKDFVKKIGVNFQLSGIKSKSELKQWIEKNFFQIKKTINRAHNTFLEYSSLQNAILYIFSPQQDWKSALDVIGKPYQRFREQNKAKLFVSPHFGMPVIHQRGKTRLVPYDKDNKRISDRRASPVIFKLIKTQDKVFFPVILWLSGAIVYRGKIVKETKPWPKGLKEQQKIATQESNYQVENNEVIKSFFENYLKNYEQLILQ